MKDKPNAYMTVYLAFFLAAILPLCMVLLEGARKNGAGLEASCAAETSAQSVLAEYHRELLKQYNLFAVDQSYGSASCTKRNTEKHLYDYLERNCKLKTTDLFSLYPCGAELTAVSLLTDNSGAVFRRRAAEAIENDVGLELLEQLGKWVGEVEVNGLESNDAEYRMELYDEEIREYEYDETAEEKVENPAAALNEMRRDGILRHVLEDGKEISTKTVDEAQLLGKRLSEGRAGSGNMNTEEEDGFLQRFLFQEYLMRYMGHYGAEKENTALAYQLEYLVAGKNEDGENLKSVAERLCILRETANVMYLYSDVQKSGEAEALAAGICTALFVPELTPAVHSAILLGWAYAESLYDVKTLLAGGRIPLLKDDLSWHTDLGTALSGGIGGDAGAGTDSKSGLSYEDYIRIFLTLTDLDGLTVRAMNMVEADIRLTPGNETFRLDGCCDRFQAKININSRHGYAFEWIGIKGY